VIGDFSVAETHARRLRQAAFAGSGSCAAAPSAPAPELVATFDVRTPGSTRLHGTFRRQHSKAHPRPRAFRPTKGLLVAQPHPGIDVVAARYIHDRVREEARRGTAVLIISEDLTRSSRHSSHSGPWVIV